MMTDIGDPTIALMEDGRLICTSMLKIAITNEPHILSVWGGNDFLLRWR